MKPRNVLILLSDEQRPDAMGCVGHPLARTPWLDALAARGTRFSNAYTPSPICVPARASLASGLPVHQHQCWDNALAWAGEPVGWGHALQRARVRVESIGKLHYRDATSPTGFDAQHEALHVAAGLGQVWGSVRDPLPETRGRSPLFDEVGPGESDYNRFDGRVADVACNWLHERKAITDQPWVLFVGFVAPHFPLVVPERYIDREAVKTLPLPPGSGDRLLQRHPWVERMKRYMDHDAAFADDEARRLAMACYWGLVNFMDEQVGRVLQALQTSDQQDNTLVIFSSDHGDNLAERGLWNKCTLYRNATGVPMIVAGPGVPQGQVCNTPVNLTDIAPTVLGAAAFPRLKAADRQSAESQPAAHPRGSLQGSPLDQGSDDKPCTLEPMDLVALANAPDQPERVVLSEYHAVGSVSAGYRLANAWQAYHHYVGFAPELFDLVNDPRETCDLAGDPRHAADLALWGRKLRSLLDPELTDQRAKQAQNALVARVGGRDAALHIGPRAASPVPGAPSVSSESSKSVDSSIPAPARRPTS